MSQLTRRLAESEVAFPTAKIHGQFDHDLFDPSATSSTRQLFDFCSKALEGLWSDRSPHSPFVHPEREPEELPRRWSTHRALCVVHLEFEFARDEDANTLHPPLRCPFRLHVDVAIIRVSNESMSALRLGLPRFRGQVVSCVRHHRLTLELHVGKVAEGRVPAARVIEAFDEVDDRSARLVVSFERGAVDQLTLERGEEALAHGVVVAVAD